MESLINVHPEVILSPNFSVWKEILFHVSLNSIFYDTSQAYPNLLTDFPRRIIMMFKCLWCGLDRKRKSTWLYKWAPGRKSQLHWAS